MTSRLRFAHAATLVALPVVEQVPADPVAVVRVHEVRPPELRICTDEIARRVADDQAHLLADELTVERLDDRTSIVFVNGGVEILETAPDDVIQPYQVSGHAPLI